MKKTSMAFAACALAASALCTPMAFAHDESGDMMKSMDTNGDGTVSKDEHATGAKSMFDQMDSNKDGVVTADEMDKAHPHSHGGMSSADKIKAVDTDGDGKLTAAEHTAGSSAMFDKMDTDHNGSLSLDEWSAGHAALQKKS